MSEGLCRFFVVVVVVESIVKLSLKGVFCLFFLLNDVFLPPFELQHCWNFSFLLRSF